MLGRFTTLDLGKLAANIASRCIGNMLGTSVGPDGSFLQSETISDLPTMHAYGFQCYRLNEIKKRTHVWAVLVEYKRVYGGDDKEVERRFNIRSRAGRHGHTEEVLDFRIAAVRFSSEIPLTSVLAVLEYFDGAFKLLTDEPASFQRWADAKQDAIIRCMNCTHHLQVRSAEIPSFFSIFSSPEAIAKNLKCSKCGVRGQVRIWSVIPGEIYPSTPRIRDSSGIQFSQQTENPLVPGKPSR